MKQKDVISSIHKQMKETGVRQSEVAFAAGCRLEIVNRVLNGVKVPKWENRIILEAIRLIKAEKAAETAFRKQINAELK